MKAKLTVLGYESLELTEYESTLSLIFLRYFIILKERMRPGVIIKFWRFIYTRFFLLNLAGTV